MAELHATDFDEFFRLAHPRQDGTPGPDPFPWQRRLTRDVIDGAGWPQVLDLPTGVGKTAAVDVAVFAMAVDAARPPRERRAPRRIVYVVDRRIVVSQAHRRAQELARRLSAAGPEDGALRRVADALRELAGASPDDVPLLTTELRGGVVRDDAWAKRPDLPLVIASTVDQVGSRLLFRGYGVSASMRPVHAGLLGNDVLYLLDEVHLSRPFAETLAALTTRLDRQAFSSELLPRRIEVVSMSATPGPLAERPYQLDDEDRQHEELARRLGAVKRARLAPPVTVPKSASEQEKAERMAKAAVAAVKDVLERGARTIGVVVNRVHTARLVHASLHAEGEVEAALLTGRMRPIDRDEFVTRVSARVDAEQPRADTGPAFVLVATQCVEAGADFDFDALVTECASLDALRQRFGRLNRRGRAPEAQAVILVRGDQVGEGAEDPVYGAALARTWRWLCAQGETVDFGSDALDLPAGEALEPLLAPAACAPVLLPSYMDTLSQTSQRTQADPAVGLWLHGLKERSAPEVNIVWRADLSAELLARVAAGAGEEQPERGELDHPAVQRVAAAPPGGLEALSVPVWAAREWLEGRGEESGALHDVVGVSDPSSGDEDGQTSMRLALLWRGDESRILRTREELAEALRGGATLVVPAEYGGITAGTWDPSSTAPDPVSDLGDRVQLQLRGQATLRLHPRVLSSWGLPASLIDARPRWPSVDAAEDGASLDERVPEWLDEVAAVVGADDWRGRIVAELRADGRGLRRMALEDDDDDARAIERVPGSRRLLVLQGRRRPQRGRGARPAAEGDDVTTEDGASSFMGRAVTLARHSKDVEAQAKGFAERLGLAPELAADVALAAWLHDVGKADPRFQVLLNGGNEIACAMQAEPLAKSKTTAGDLSTRRMARLRSGHPWQARHELLSLAMIEQDQAVRSRVKADAELVLHLVASHHGWCRPLAPAFADEALKVELQHDGLRLIASTDHRYAQVDSGVADRFWALTERYGWHGLAWLEAILRLADHRASALEEQE